MKEMDAILGCDAVDSACSLQNRPWALDVKVAKNDKPASVSVKGPLAEAGTVVQVFLLQYANGFPPNQVAFGKASTADDIIRLSALRQMKYDVGNRVPYLAQRDASNFLNQILLSLDTKPSRTDRRMRNSCCSWAAIRSRPRSRRCSAFTGKSRPIWTTRHRQPEL